MMVKPTTNPKTGTPKAKPATSSRGANLLKSTLVISSIVATLLGANLAAQKDQTPMALATTDFSAMASVASVPNRPVPGNLVSGRLQQRGAVPNPATTDSTVDDLLNTLSAPLPTINIPTVVTSSRSSQ